MENLTSQIIEAQEPYVVVNASAAAGKTYCITERVRWLLKNGIKPENMVVITFTNMAAEEMRERLGNDGDGCFIGTIHSYVNHILLMGGVYTGEVLEEEQFDKLFKMLIENPHCARPIGHLLLDEAQDTDELQWITIFDILKPNNWTIVGDTRQSIYGFRGAEPENFMQIMNRADVKVYNLLYNHRNGSNILNYAKQIINRSDSDLMDNSISMNTNSGQVIECEYDEGTILKYIQSYDYEYKDWFILTRTNAQLEVIKTYLERHNIPCDSFKRSDLTHKELAERIKNNTVKVLTIHAAKGLEAKAVVTIGTRFWNDEERRVNYVAATRAKELLIWTKENKVDKKFKKKMQKEARELQKDMFNWE